MGGAVAAQEGLFGTPWCVPALGTPSRVRGRPAGPLLGLPGPPRPRVLGRWQRGGPAAGAAPPRGGRVRGVRGGAGRAPPRPGLAPVIVVGLAVGFVQAFPGARPAGPGQSVGRVVAVRESPAVPGRRGAGRARGPGSPGRARVARGGRRVVGGGPGLLLLPAAAAARAVGLVVVGAPVVTVVVPGARGALSCVRAGRRPSRPSVATRRPGGLAPGRARDPPLHRGRAAAAVASRGRPLPGQGLGHGARVPPRAAGGRSARPRRGLLLLLGTRAAGLTDHGGIGHARPGSGGGLGELAASPPRSAGTRC